MNDLTKFLDPDLARRVESRIAESEFTDAEEYVRELVRRDLAEAADTAWVREQVAIGLASGIIDQDPREVIEEIIAERRARRA